MCGRLTWKKGQIEAIGDRRSKLRLAPSTLVLLGTAHHNTRSWRMLGAMHDIGIELWVVRVSAEAVAFLRFRSMGDV